MDETLVAWVGFRIWKSRGTLGLSIRKTIPFTYHDATVGWHLVPHPFFSISSEKAGDFAIRLEWLGVIVYLRMTV